MAQKKNINWGRTYAVVAAIDAIQIVIDFIPPVGEVVNEVLDVMIGIGLNVWAWRKGLLDFMNVFIVVGTFGIEEATAGGAPFWVADIFAFQKRSGGMIEAIAPNPSLVQNGRREPTPPAPRYEGGRQEPLVIK